MLRATLLPYATGSLVSNMKMPTKGSCPAHGLRRKRPGCVDTLCGRVSVSSRWSAPDVRTHFADTFPLRAAGRPRMCGQALLTHFRVEPLVGPGCVDTRCGHISVSSRWSARDVWTHFVDRKVCKSKMEAHIRAEKTPPGGMHDRVPEKSPSGGVRDREQLEAAGRRPSN